MTTSVLIADGQAIVRAGLRSVLASRSCLEISAEASTDVELARIIEECHPDLVITDMLSPPINAVEVIHRCMSNDGGPRFLVFSSCALGDDVVHVLRLGAHGFIPKSASTEEILEAVDALAAGGVYVGRAVLRSAGDETPGDHFHLPPTSRITTRERHVLALLARGCSNRDVAERLGVSIRTIETHRQNLRRKLELRSTADLVRYAVRAGIVDA